MKKVIVILSLIITHLGFAQTAELNRNSQAAVSFLPGNGNSIFHIAHGLNNDLNISHGTSVGTANIMTIKNGGSVGIGVTSPLGKLHVNGETYIQRGVVNFITANTDIGGSTGIKANPNGWSRLDPNGSRFIMTVKNSDVASRRNILDIENTEDSWRHLMELRADGSAFFMGKMGIGTANPASQFEVSTSDNKRVRLNYNNESAITFWPNNGNSVFHLSHGHDNKLHFSHGSIVGAGKIMTIGNTGSVGIGTTDTKGFKLGVQGKIAAEEVKVATYANWADFVFDSTYKLPTLKEVEQHIKEKGHLKDIPSAKEVKEDGFFLGEMDSKLLQKIEELTLYTIEQEKKIQELSLLKEENELLRKKFETLEALVSELVKE
ncbi:hypothetical protein [Flavivirga eckloniae]|nr:hypothetical protein [Flavivirga eckloniae]